MSVQGTDERKISVHDYFINSRPGLNISVAILCVVAILP